MSEYKFNEKSPYFKVIIFLAIFGVREGPRIAHPHISSGCKIEQQNS